jgi:hypothetical protein
MNKNSLVTIIALVGIASLVTASLLIQSAGATDVMNTEGAVESSNNNSNVALGNLFYIGQGIEETFNPINETYFVISTVSNVTIIPPNATTTINATEISNFTINILPNGLARDHGQSLIVTEGDNGGAEQDTATGTLVDISRVNPDATGNSTGVVFFSTNSTGQLAFLNNMIGISQVEFSPQGLTVRIWEWKGGSIPFENGSEDGAAATTENQTTTTP